MFLKFIHIVAMISAGGIQAIWGVWSEDDVCGKVKN